MRNIKLIIEYDGTSYAGWQIQPNGLTIQQVIEEALVRVLGASVRLHSSGRTDAGVHARGMVAAFRTDREIPLRAFSDGLNALLPPDIAVRDACEARSDFQPRFDAKGKHYRYTIHNGTRRSPLSRLYAWQLRGKLDIGAMREAARHFVGEHDFAAFRTTGCAARTTVRRIDAVELDRDGDLIQIEVKGSGFLRNMVRIMVGTLVEVGQGKRPADAIAVILAGANGVPAGATAPPHGLCLMEVYY
ncbi:MAG: tRNA pseudouridine(38-40) synthase TruA [Geobacteraceae bacterium]|nr:tRNA pseudouridine(38-40) synthase TruA [Geobacteraceae bacterium]